MAGHGTGEQQPRPDKMALYDLLTCGVMDGAVIHFTNGLDYVVGTGFFRGDALVPRLEAYELMREHWVASAGIPGRKKGIHYGSTGRRKHGHRQVPNPHRDERLGGGD